MHPQTSLEKFYPIERFVSCHHGLRHLLLGGIPELLLKRALVDHRIAIPLQDGQQDILLTRKTNLPAR